ncbi:hypothetical protein EP7_005590 (plasmid) [Isosphaeraceae bacterium EP7]
MRLTKQTAQQKHVATAPDQGRSPAALPLTVAGQASGLSRRQRLALAAKSRGRKWA